MSKILITNPPGRCFIRARGDNWPSVCEGENVIYTSFPYLLAAAAGSVEKAGHEVLFVDCVAEGIERDEFKATVESFEPALIVMMTSTPSYHYDVETRKGLGETVAVVAGGVHASATPERHLEDGFDYVLRGEFDNTLVELIANLGNMEKLKGFAGICFKDSNEHYISGFSEPVMDLNELPFPAYHLLKMDLYNEPFAKGKNIMMLTTRGCPHQCNYCCVPYFYGGPIYRKRDAKLVVDEIEYLVDKFRIDEVYFDDSSITVDKKHLLSLATEIKNRNIGISWSCMGNAYISNEMLETLADSGCRGLKIGIETGNEEVLGDINKKTKQPDVFRVVKKCHELGMKVHGTYMIGLPGETAAKTKETIDFMLKLNTNTVQIAIATPFPGTQFYKDAQANGWFVSEDWSLLDGNHAALSYPDFSSEEILRLFRQATKRWERHVVFTKPTTILHHLYGLYKRRGLTGIFDGIGYGVNILLGKTSSR